MEQEDSNSEVNEPLTEYLLTGLAGLPTGQAGSSYTNADYLGWDKAEMVELIKGKIFRHEAALPRKIHQKISGKVFNRLFNFLEDHPCEAYEDPFYVRLPVKSKRNEDIDTVVKPDICVICGKSKLDELGCVGAPDLIIKILSPGSNRKEIKFKYEVYEESRVGEYWIIHPDEQTVLTYTLEKGQYVPSRLFTSGDILDSKTITGFHLELEYVFRDLD